MSCVVGLERPTKSFFFKRMVWDTNFIPSYTSSLGALAVEQYVPITCTL